MVHGAAGREVAAPASELTPHNSHHHRAFYGLTCEAYDELRRRASDRCEVCGADPAEVHRQRGLFIDHDHAVGQHAVRGLLCARCNTGLRLVDGGGREPTDAEASYLANAWHLTHMVWSPVRAVRQRQQVTHAATASPDD